MDHPFFLYSLHLNYYCDCCDCYDYAIVIVAIILIKAMVVQVALLLSVYNLQWELSWITGDGLCRPSICDSIIGDVDGLLLDELIGDDLYSLYSHLYHTEIEI